MMLHAITLKHRRAAVVHVDRAGDRDRALGHQQPVALVHRNVQVIGDDVELLARHFEHGAGEQAHGVPPFRADGSPLRRWIALSSGAGCKRWREARPAQAGPENEF